VGSSQSQWAGFFVYSWLLAGTISRKDSKDAENAKIRGRKAVAEVSGQSQIAGAFFAIRFSQRQQRRRERKDQRAEGSRSKQIYSCIRGYSMID
jgi:hypothetical protein